MITATRFHDFSCGHRVVGHEGACSRLHGHNYRVHFTVAPWTPPKATRPSNNLDNVGRVLDFSVINTKLCQWLETNWDHRMLMWENDPLCKVLGKYPSSGVVVVPFNPTAEQMAIYLVESVGPSHLHGTGCQLVHVMVEETRKCSASYSLGDRYGTSYVVE